jgi:hypothetical protein
LAATWGHTWGTRWRLSFPMATGTHHGLVGTPRHSNRIPAPARGKPRCRASSKHEQGSPPVTERLHEDHASRDRRLLEQVRAAGLGHAGAGPFTTPVGAGYFTSASVLAIPSVLRDREISAPA